MSSLTSAPGTGLPTRLVAIARNGLTADALEEQLRRLDPPLIARIEHDRVVLDLRTVEPEDDHTLATLLISDFGMPTRGRILEPAEAGNAE